MLGGTIYLNKRRRLQSKSHSRGAAAKVAFFFVTAVFIRTTFGGAAS
jgi:hypothetical protein